MLLPSTALGQFLSDEELNTLFEGLKLFVIDTFFLSDTKGFLRFSLCQFNCAEVDFGDLRPPASHALGVLRVGRDVLDQTHRDVGKRDDEALAEGEPVAQRLCVCMWVRGRVHVGGGGCCGSHCIFFA